MKPVPSRIQITLPAWLRARLTSPLSLDGDEARMRFVIELAHENVARRSGGPFGAAVFRADGLLVAAGVNRVERLRNAALHAEVVALMFAQARLGTYSLHTPGPAHILVTSCEPCAMCLGAILWSGVRRLVCGARREDAQATGFDEGPVTPASYHYLEARGITVVRNVLRAEAATVLADYHARGGLIYNA